MNENQLTKYINTPFAYTRTQKGLTLLQQNIMVRVSAHLQDYFDKFFRTPALCSSKDAPKPVMTEEDRDNLPPVRIRFSELGVSSGTYSRIRKALQEILDATFEFDALSKEGKPVRRMMHLFSGIEIPTTEKGTTVRMRVGDDRFDLSDVKVDRTRGFFEISLNKDAVFSMFDMNQGYVSHPEDIAKIGEVPNMPLMYYFIRHKMQNFKVDLTKATLFDLRDYLGMIQRDTDGNIVKVLYRNYGQFKSRIIKTALDDIKRVCDNGQIDFYFEMEEIRANGKKTGDPEFLVFKKVANKEAAKQNYRQASEKRLMSKLMKSYPALDKEKVCGLLKSVSDAQWDDFKNYAYKKLPKAVEQQHQWNGTREEYVAFLLESWISSFSIDKQKKTAPQQQSFSFDVYEHVDATPKEKNVYTSDYIKEWHDVLDGYNGPLKENILRGRVLGKGSNGLLVIEFSKDDAALLLKSPEWEQIREAFKRVIGKKYGPGIQIAMKD